jgi:rod shape determining protein RodA
VELSGSSARVDRRIWTHIPWPLLLLALAIAALGVWNLASAARTAPTPVWKAQVTWIGLGLVACALLCAADYRYLMQLAYPIYGMVLVLLVMVFLRGKVIMGARRWLDLGPMNLQPSELMKIAIIIALARFFDGDVKKEGYSLRELLFPGVLVVTPVVLIMMQPDLGTAMMVALIAGTMVLFAKVRLRALLTLSAGGVLAAILVWLYVLKEYQKKRVLTFLNPEGDSLGAGYHASQSLIAVGSGQGSGKGWGQGTQTQLSFLPEQHTDFIFSVWGEEHGFVGGVVLIALYLLLLLLAVAVAMGARETFGTYLCVGVAAMIFWHVFVNIGMVTGVLPVVGVTLPLMSYGGSSVLTVLIGLGLLMNVGMRRHMF